ncbi:MAG TPA: isopentenyl transferase family protein, partial [Pirellulales bacterium]|nr:isopentenyl transferase family protein [Pirellulales bacterium]
MTDGNVNGSPRSRNRTAAVTSRFPPARPSTFAPLFADCWCLTGPTASGKSEVGIELARRIGAEIVSLDSMAVYRGMDIGTAKPTPSEQKSIAHHLLNVVDP